MAKNLTFLIFLFWSLNLYSQDTTRRTPTPPNRYSEYEPNYFINSFGDIYGQAKFKISFKYDFGCRSPKGKVYFAYTQFAFWDLWKPSAPIRELDFTPMLMYQYSLNEIKHVSSNWNLNIPYWKLGYLHQSNGKSDSTNRSIFKVFAHSNLTFSHEINNRTFKIKKISFFPQLWLWNILSDENANIADYQGYGQLITSVSFDYNNKSIADTVFPLCFEVILIPAKVATTYALNLIINPFLNKCNWFPNIYFQYWNGYGENLINYDNRLNGYNRISTLRVGVQFRVK